MVDRELRERERAAQAGDIDAHLAHGLARMRAGDPETLLALLEAEPVAGGEALERAVSPQQVAEVCGLLLERLARVKRGEDASGSESRGGLLPSWRPEYARRRPAMYVGSTHSSGLTVMVSSVLELSAWEAVAGLCTRISVALQDSGHVVVDSDAPGWPLVAWVVCLEGAQPWRVIGARMPHGPGISGVGVEVTDALSSELCLELRRRGATFRWLRAHGHSLGPPILAEPAIATGVTLRYRADPGLFNASLEPEAVEQRLEELAYLLPRVRLEWQLGGARVGSRARPAGLQELVSEHAVRPPRRPFLWSSGGLGGNTSSVGVRVSLALVVDLARDQEWVASFVNLGRTRSGGSHVLGLCSGAVKGVRRWLRADAPARVRERARGVHARHLRRSMAGAISIIHDQAQFEGATRSRLSDVEVEQRLRTELSEPFHAYLAEHPDLAEAWVRRAAGAG